MFATLRVTVPESLELDLAGAWALRGWLKTAEDAGATVEFAGSRPGQLELIDSTLAGKVHADTGIVVRIDLRAGERARPTSLRDACRR